MVQARSTAAHAARAPVPARTVPGARAPGTRLDAIQYLRAVAALSVVHAHASAQLPVDASARSPVGAFGVDLFFVISGFVMVHVARPEDTPARFFARRVRRVVPLYWGFTLLLALVLVAAPGAFGTTRLSPDALLGSLAFVPYRADFGDGALQPLLSVGWTLNYEMYFYALFALSLYAPPRLRPVVAAGAIGAVYLVCSAVGPRTAALEFYGAAIAFEFVLGMALAKAWHGSLLPSSRPLALAVATAATLCLLTLQPPSLYDHTTRLFYYGLPATALVAAALCVEPPAWRLGALLGDASYAIYLSHPFALGAFGRILPPPADAGALGAIAFVVPAVVASSAVGIGVHLLLERRPRRRAVPSGSPR